MSIIYCTVSRGGLILTEHAITSGNFMEVTRCILSKLGAQDSKMSYQVRLLARVFFLIIIILCCAYLCFVLTKDTLLDFFWGGVPRHEPSFFAHCFLTNHSLTIFGNQLCAYAFNHTAFVSAV
jgi:hypothetical protein